MDVFTAVADPTRRRLMELLADGDRPAGELVDAVATLSQPAVSRHLRVLREAGLVSSTAIGQQRRYRLERAGFQELQAWLDRYRRFWGSALDSLVEHLAPPPIDPSGEPHDH